MIMFPAFKNGHGGASLRVAAVEVTDWQLGESPLGIHAQKNRVEGYALFSNSIIIGDTDNKGKFQCKAACLCADRTSGLLHLNC